MNRGNRILFFLCVFGVFVGGFLMQAACAQEKKDRELWKKLKEKEKKHVRSTAFQRATRLYEKNRSTFRTDRYQTLCEEREEAMTRCRKAFEKIIKWINNGDRRIQDGSMNGLKVRPVKADRDSVNFSVVDGDGGFEKKWRDLVDRVPLTDFLRVVRLTETELFRLSTWAIHAGHENRGKKLLVRAYNMTEDIHGNLFEYLAMLDETSVPDGGYKVNEKGTDFVRVDREDSDQRLPARPMKKNKKSNDENNGSGDKKKNTAHSKEAHLKHIDALGKKYAPNGDLTITREGALDEGGRPWSNPWSLSTKHYNVDCSISKKATGEVGLLMEILYYNYADAFQLPYEELPTQPMDVKIPKNRAQFNKIRQVSDGTRGWFSPVKELLCIPYQYDNKMWNTAKVIMHEGGHQFVYYAFESDPPSWLNEAIAEYFRAAHFARGSDGGVCRHPECGYKVDKSKSPFPLHFGGILEKRLDVALHELSNYSLKRLLTLDPNRARPGYNVGWSFVHAMAYAENRKYNTNLRKFVRWFQSNDASGKSKVELFKETFKGYTMSEVEKDWKSYIRGLTTGDAYPK